MSAFFRATSALRSCRPTRTPLSSTFFSTTSPRKPIPSSLLRPSPSSALPSLRHVRFYSGGFRAGGQRQVSMNMAVIYGLIGANAAIFVYATYAKMQATQGYQQNLIQFMRNFTINLTDVQNGQWRQMITSVFTHTDLFHFGGNMITFYYLGRFLAYAPQVTPGRFLIIAIGSGITGSVGYLINRRQALAREGGGDYKRGLGFSGAVMGVSAVAACLAPTAKVHLYGIVPVPLWGLVAGYAAYDGFYLNESKTRTAHAGHLGGLAFGLAYYLVRIRFRVF